MRPVKSLADVKFISDDLLPEAGRMAVLPPTRSLLLPVLTRADLGAARSNWPIVTAAMRGCPVGSEPSTADSGQHRQLVELVKSVD